MLAYLALSVLLASSILAAPSEDIALKVGALLESSHAVQSGSVGFKFVDAATGEVVSELNGDKFFAPASNAKLYTTALALVRLGPDYKFRTELRTSRGWVPGQTALPDLQLIGGGDLNLSGRVLPYAPHSTDGDPFAALKELAAKLNALGVREILGDVTGISTRYTGDLYPDGWTIDDSIYSYGAPVTALALNDNAVSMIVAPTADGELADVTLQPLTGQLVLVNQILTDTSNSADIHLARRAGSSEVVLSGSIGLSAQPWHEDLAVTDPALFAAEALIQVLRESGISVRGVARSQYVSADELGPAPLAYHESGPLWQDIQVTNKVSQNLHAEMLLREVGYVCRGAGTSDAGRAERDTFLEQIGTKHDGSRFALDDGSGLARQDLATPESTVTLLHYMWQRPERNVWLQSLPSGAVDGTLEKRFQHVAGAERVHAKTGSYSHVNTLSGYMETDRHRWLTFSVMVNATVAPDAEIRSFIDHLCAIFLQE